MAQTPQAAPAPQLSARNGMLTSKFEGKFGTPDVLRPSMTEVNGGPPPTPRGLAPGLKTFTDAQNPFNRNQSKAAVSTEAHKADLGRAGMRSRNPGIIPASCDRASNTDSAGPRVIPHRYSTEPDYKPGKSFSGRYVAKDSPIAHHDAPFQAKTSTGRGLQNYLNDMKSCTSSRRAHKDWSPSPRLQKMNDMKVKLGAEIRDESRDRNPPERRTEPGAVPLTPRGCEDSPLFARKSRTTPCSTPRDEGEPANRIWAHEEVSTESLPRAQSLQSQRRRQADARMEEINQHMSLASPRQKDNFETFKARGMNGSGVFPLGLPMLAAEDTTTCNESLNDVKRRASLRVHKDWGPSAILQKMNDMKVKLGAEIRDESRDRNPPRGCEDSDDTSSVQDEVVLAADICPGNGPRARAASMRTRRNLRSHSVWALGGAFTESRQRAADARIDEIQQHMRNESYTSSRKAHKAWGPSAMLQKMNDMKMKLGAEIRDESRDRNPPERLTEPGAVPLTPRTCEDSPLFARKRRTTICSTPRDDAESATTPDDTGSVQGEVALAAGICRGDGHTPRARAATMRTRRNLRSNSIWAHEDEEVFTDSRQRAQSLQSERRRQADAHMEEINQHMRDALAWRKGNFETIKAQGTNGSGVFPVDQAKLAAEDTTTRSQTGRMSRSVSSKI